MDSSVFIDQLDTELSGIKSRPLLSNKEFVFFNKKMYLTLFAFHTKTTGKYNMIAYIQDTCHTFSFYDGRMMTRD